MLPELVRYVDSIRKSQIFYEKHFPYLQNYATCFYGFEHDSPITGSINFSLKNKVNESTSFVDIISFTTGEPPNLVNVIRLGEHNAVDRYLNSDFINKYGLGGGLVELMKLQARKTPDHVAPPIILLKITKKALNGF